MRIFVASGTALRYADEGSAEIFDLDERAFARGNVLGSMAFLALHSGMFSFEDVTRLPVIECFRVPLDEWEVNAVVIGVALDALLAGTGTDAIGGMQAFVGR